ncbi:EAL domain-containing protein [Caminibacter mediatlanticus TB-2]|uniref:EAL domain-containing protein n=1 Tax=Caminibacter mediatlanticus TB-2 TaxID=391592 RepID=A0ABX5V8W5_9BACT|nr:EAL domain-containing protein [Caminibacter mediatlanticus]QCT94735.1 EAL domain-containing protein [Caminibacter mediatlanticus TB-2]
MIAKEVKKVLPHVLDKVKVDLFNDEIFNSMFDESEYEKVFLALESMLNEYIEVSINNEECEISYFDIAKYKLPFFVVLKSINLIKKELILYLNNNGFNSETILEIDEFLQKALNLVAKLYIKMDIEKINITSQYDKYLLFKPHIELNKLIVKSIKEDYIDPNVIQKPEKCMFNQVMQYPESLMVCMDVNLCNILHEIHNLLHKNINIFYRFLVREDYVQAYLVLKDFIEINHKFSSTIKDLYYSTYNNLEVSFFKLIEMLGFSDKKQIVSMIDIKDLKYLNNIYGEDIVNEVLERLYNLLKEKIKKYASNMLIIKGLSANFYLLSIDNDEKSFKKFILNIFDSLPKKLEIKSKIIDISYILASFSLDDNIKYEKNDLIRIMLHLKELAKKNNNIYLVYEQKEKEELIKWLKDKFFSVNFIKEKLENGEVDVVFQPIFDKNLNIYSTEVLARIKDKNRLISAGMFIDTIYEMGKIVELDRLVLKALLNKKDKLNSISKIFINASPSSILDNIYFQELIEFIEIFGSEKIIIEITEQQALNNMNVIKDIHKKTGVSFAIDDFGSGYSALKTVVDLIDTGMIKLLKIDGELIKTINKDEKLKQIVEIIYDMCKRLEILSLAEFVENKESLNILQEIGIDLYQGFYLSTPLKIEELMMFELNLK